MLRFLIDYLFISPSPTNWPTHIFTLKSNSGSCYQILRFPGRGCYVKHSCWPLCASTHSTNHIYFWIPQLPSGRSISFAQACSRINGNSRRSGSRYVRVAFFRHATPPHTPDTYVCTHARTHFLLPIPAPCLAVFNSRAGCRSEAVHASHSERLVTGCDYVNRPELTCDLNLKTPG